MLMAYQSKKLVYQLQHIAEHLCWYCYLANGKRHYTRLIVFHSIANYVQGSLV